MSTTGVYEVVKGNLSGAPVFATPGGSYRPLVEGILSILARVFRLYSVKTDRFHLGLLEDRGATGSGVPEKQIIELRSDEVPGISLWASCGKEVGVCVWLRLIQTKSCAGLILSQQSCFV